MPKKASNKPSIFGELNIPLIPTDASPYDEDNPYSLINLVSPMLRKAIENLPIRHFRYNEKELRRSAKPSPEICRLRISFWDEYLLAIEQQRKMEVINVVKGVCSVPFFYDVLVRDPNILAYIVVAPADYQLAMREMLELGWSRMREVLEMDLELEEPYNAKVFNEETGKTETVTKFRKVPNIALIGQMRALVQMLDMRIKGAVIQRMQIDQRNLNLNATVGSGGQPALADMTLQQLEAMEKRIEQMRSAMDGVEMLNGSSEETPDRVEITIGDSRQTEETVAASPAEDFSEEK